MTSQGAAAASGGAAGACGVRLERLAPERQGPPGVMGGIAPAPGRGRGRSPRTGLQLGGANRCD